MNTRLILQREGKTIFSLKCKPSKKSKYGELDIMIDAGKNLYFNQVVAGNFFRHYHLPEDKTDGVSWHGYYESINERLIYTPIIHFKNGRDKIAREWHLGSINHEEPFAFPVCSVYLPREMDLSNVYPSQYEKHKKIKYFIKEFDNSSDQRIDIFITSKGISAKKVLKLSIGWIYKFIDVDVFNDGKALPLHKDDMANGLEVSVDNSGHDMLIRTVRNQVEASNFTSLKGSYSLLVHDPNDSYQRIVNRPVIEIDQGANVLSEQGLLYKAENLKEKYEKELMLWLFRVKEGGIVR